MTQEEKDLLLSDLCARLPYNVIVEVSDMNDASYHKNGVLHKVSNMNSDCNGTNFLFGVDGETCSCDITEIKPYLRSMRRMTKEEKDSYNKACKRKWVKCVDCTHGGYYDYELTYKAVEWLKAHHFDYRGLI